MSVEAPCEVLTWETSGEAGRELGEVAVDDAYRPDLVLTIARGGLLRRVPPLWTWQMRGVLLVDDEGGTGETLRLLSEFCGEDVAECRTAVVQETPRSTVKCEHGWRGTDPLDRLLPGPASPL